MLKKSLFLIGLYCVCFFFCKEGFVCYAENYENLEPFRFSEDFIESYRSNPDFQYSDPTIVENWLQKLERKFKQAINQFLRWIFGDAKYFKTVDFIFQALPYLAIIGISILLIWLIGKYDLYTGSDKKLLKSQVNFSDDAAIMERRDIHQLIEDAIANADYRSAVRYSYLSILKKMKEQSLIDWKIQKTNRDYLAELPEGTLRSDFARVTMVYDYIWYGGFELDRSGFEVVRRNFNQVEKKL